MLLYSVIYIMSTDGSMNLSNITTNFNLGSNSPFYDILSTIVTDSSNNKITLISSDPSGVFYGNAFVLGQLLIQFSIKNTSYGTSSGAEQVIFFPYGYSATPYTMFLNGFNQAGVITTQLINYSKTNFVYTTNLNSYLNFMVIGPLPDTPFPSSINMTQTYDADGADDVTWQISSNGTPTMTVTYGASPTTQYLYIYRPCQSIQYKITGSSGGGGGGSKGNANNAPGTGGGGGGAGECISENINNTIDDVEFAINVGYSGAGGLGGGPSTVAGGGGNGAQGGNGNSSYVTYNNSTTSTSNGGNGGNGGIFPSTSTSGNGGNGGKGGDSINGTAGGTTTTVDGGIANNQNQYSGTGGGCHNGKNPGVGGSGATYGGAGGTAGMWANSGNSQPGVISTYGGNGGESGHRSNGGNNIVGGTGVDGILHTSSSSPYYSTTGGGGGGGGYADDSGRSSDGGPGGSGVNGIVVFVVTFL